MIRRLSMVWLALAVCLVFYSCRDDDKDPPGHKATCLKLFPKGGHCDGGTPVTIDTTGFSDDFTVDVPRVFFGGVESTSVTPLDEDSVLAIAPPYPSPTPGGRYVVDVVLESQGGQECVFHDGFVYECPGGPACLHLQPEGGDCHGGTHVKIKTSGFPDDFTVDLPRVFFGGVEATAVSAVDAATLMAVSPPYPNPSPGGRFVVDVVVEAASGHECVFHDGFVYECPSGPTCLHLKPEGGDCHGGTHVTITTTGFSDDFTVDLPRVWFGGVESTTVTAVDNRTVIAVSPPYPNPTPGGRFIVDVVLESASGQECIFQDGFLYECPGGPKCLSLFPKGGDCHGGTPVTIETSGFADDFTVNLPRVFFGGVEATAVTPIDAQSVVAETPPYPNPAPGGRYVVDVVLESHGGQECIFNDGFVYECPSGPKCLSLHPKGDLCAGGADVTIETSGFADDFTVNLPRVWFGTEEATSVSAIDATTLSAIAPPYPNPAPGGRYVVDVLVDAGNEECVFTDGFVYECPNGCMSIDPDEGPLAGGNRVLIESLDICVFDSNTEVFFGGVPATNIDIISPTKLHCTVPAGNHPGPVDVTFLAEDPNGRPCDCRLVDGYTYVQ